MIKQFFLRQAMKSQLKDVPEAEREMLLDAVEKNPEIFIKIAEETQAKIKSGMSQMDAMMSVLTDHKDEMKDLFPKK